jgi:acetate kinase
MKRAIIVINAGSSSIKFALFEAKPELARKPAIDGQIEGIGGRPRLLANDADGLEIEARDLDLSGQLPLEQQHRDAMAYLLQWLDRHDDAWLIAGVGHRVVHGGERYADPLPIDAGKVEEWEAFVPLAPLHQPHNLAAIRAIMAISPQLPQVACFDTAFHRTQPAVAQAFALPRALTAKGIRRYGFHGLSYEYIASVLPEHLGARAEGRVVVGHFGNGVSMCAMHGRRSVAATLGFTALDGLMMGTRCGALDPGVLLYLMEFEHMGREQLTQLLYKESGLLGVSGISHDMRTLLASTALQAREAVDLFCYRITRELGSLAAALGGLDALVFTGGIGENAVPVRERVCLDAEWLGVRLNRAANEANSTRISSPESSVDVLIVPTNEEWVIARHTADVLAARG